MINKRFILLLALVVFITVNTVSCAYISKIWENSASSDEENIFSDDENNSSDEDETSLVDNPLFEDKTAIEKITVYAPSKTVSRKVNRTEDGKIVELIGFDIVYETENQNEINKILAMFNGWNPEENIVHELLDLSCDIYIRFGDVLTLSYHSPGADINYYGTIESSYHYLPKKFGELIDSLITK